jgi:DNA polymerase III gamma/tau subunit
MQSLDEYLKLNRPRAFRDILGHNRWLDALESNLKQERLTTVHQPIALIGQPGVGKRTLARMYAQALICEQALVARTDAAPCGQCDECRAMDTSSFAYVEKNVAGAIGDEMDRQPEQKDRANIVHTLIERDGGLNTAAVRIVVFNDAEELAGEAADIALKTVEEDIARTLYVFVVNDEERFSAALRSRCSIYRIGPILAEDIVGRLSRICRERGTIGDETALQAIAVAAAGSFARALQLLEPVERGGAVTTARLIEEPEFAWGTSMLDCWRAMFSARYDEALVLFGKIGTTGPMRLRAMQAFLVTCHMHCLLGEVHQGLSVAPALSLLPDEKWERAMREWDVWSFRQGLAVQEAIASVLAFWTAVDPDTPWRASFARGYEILWRVARNQNPREVEQGGQPGKMLV